MESRQENIEKIKYVIFFLFVIKLIFMFFFLQRKNTNSDVNVTVNCVESNQKTESL